MKLSGEQLNSLHIALCDAYTEESLRRMVRISLEEDLDTIAGGKNFADLTFDLIAWAERYGRVSELVSSAHAHNPNNTMIQMLHDQFIENDIMNNSRLVNELKALIETNPSIETLKGFICTNKQIFISGDESYFTYPEPIVLENFRIQDYEADVAKFTPIGPHSNMPGVAELYTFLGTSDTLDSAEYVEKYEALTAVIEASNSTGAFFASELQKREDYRTAICPFDASGKIYLGRRAKLSKAELAALQIMNTKNGVQVLTYDSLLEILLMAHRA